jgi:hypothetical protein
MLGENEPKTRFHKVNGSKFHRKTYFPKANGPKYLSEKCQVFSENMFPYSLGQMSPSSLGKGGCLKNMDPKHDSME